MNNVFDRLISVFNKELPTSLNTALPLRVAESKLMMSDKQDESWSGRDHIDSLTESAGRADSKKNARLVSSSTSAMPNVR